MKKSKKISFFIMFIIMAFFIVKNYSNGGIEADASSSPLALEVNLTNGNEKAGDLVYYIVDSSGNISSESYTSGTTVKYGTKIYITFKDGLAEGYFVNLWASTNGATYNIIESSTDSDEYYKQDYLIYTVKTDISVYVMPLSANDRVVTFYETSAIEKASIIGFSVVSMGEAADLDDVFVPKRKGFDFIGWSQDYNNITEDTIIYPVYDSNVITIFRDYWPLFLKGLGMTILLAIISIVLSLAFGISLCLLNISNNKVAKVISSTYIEVIRGIPSLLLLLLIYCVVGPTQIKFGSFFTTEIIACILALFANSSAYTAEIFRSGIQAVDAGQTEAGRALGMSNWQVLRKIVIPQGLKNALPSLCNELIMIIKETSLAYSVNNAIGELMCAKVSITSATGNALSPYLIIAAIYFIVTFSLSKGVKYLEKRLSE